MGDVRHDDVAGRSARARRLPRATCNLATDAAVIASSDHCATWQDLGLGMGAVAVATAATRTLAATYNGLYSYDGTSWTQAAFAGELVSDIAVSSDGQRVYVGTGGYEETGGGMACSSDAGATFAACNNGLQGSATDYIVGDGADPLHAFAQVQDPSLAYAVVSTSDGGSSWQTLSTSGGSILGVDPADDSFVVWNSWGLGLQVSSDGGMTFDGNDHRSASMFDASVNRLVYAPGSQVYAATDRGLFGATSHQLQWSELDAGDLLDLGCVQRRGRHRRHDLRRDRRGRVAFHRRRRHVGRGDAGARRARVGRRRGARPEHRDRREQQLARAVHRRWADLLDAVDPRTGGQLPRVPRPRDRDRCVRDGDGRRRRDLARRGHLHAPRRRRHVPDRLRRASGRRRRDTAGRGHRVRRRLRVDGRRADLDGVQRRARRPRR